MPLAPTQCLTLSLLVLPPVVLSIYLFAQFPQAPPAFQIHASLASLPVDSPARVIYGEDYYSNGAYVSLPYGRVRYWMLGPEDGEKVVMIHGLSIPSIVWKDVAPELASKGFRVLLYDLYGRGYSDAPRITYDAKLYVTQLALLMQHLRWESVHVVGFSMGGAIAASFSAAFPHLVSGKVALVASTGIMEATDFSRTVKFMSSPFILAIITTSPIRKYLQSLAGNRTTSSDSLTELVRIQSAHLPGFDQAIASSLRDGPVRGLEQAFSTMSSRNYQVLLIWGTADDSVPFKYAGRVQGLVPKARLVTVDGAGHELPLTHPKVISDSLVQFLREP